jgi:hypothetical protein
VYSVSFGNLYLLGYSAAGAFILNVTYGYQVEPRGEDPLVQLANHGLCQFAKATVPGAWLVDLIPARTFLPMSPRIDC